MLSLRAWPRRILSRQDDVDAVAHGMQRFLFLALAVHSPSLWPRDAKGEPDTCLSEPCKLSPKIHRVRDEVAADRRGPGPGASIQLGRQSARQWGGNMWPMLAGIGPVPGEGDHLGEFFNTDGHSVWKYRDGVASEVADNGKEDRDPR